MSFLCDFRFYTWQFLQNFFKSIEPFARRYVLTGY
jgi:hypothetical protein